MSLSGPSKASRSGRDFRRTARAWKAASGGFLRGWRARRPPTSTPGRSTALGRGRSLLPAGVVNVKGPFDRGDSVNIVGPEGKAIGCGVANYSAADLERIKGCRSAEITTDSRVPLRRRSDPSE